MRHSISTSTAAILFAVLGSGCAGAGTKTFESFNINEGTSVSIDATQRVILVKQTKEGRLVCAEPSPDAVVAASAQIAAKAKVSEGPNRKANFARAGAINMSVIALKTLPKNDAASASETA